MIMSEADSTLWIPVVLDLTCLFSPVVLWNPPLSQGGDFLPIKQADLLLCEDSW